MLAPRPARRGAQAAHMVSKGDLPPTTPLSTTKRLASVGPPPLGPPGRRTGRGARCPQGCPEAKLRSCPRWVQLRGGPGGGRGQVGRPRGNTARERAEEPGGARGARGDAASSRDLKGSEGRRDPCLPIGTDPSATRDASQRPGASSPKSLLSLRRGSTRRGTHFFLGFLRLPPQSPVKATEAASRARAGVVSLRPAEGTHFRVLPPFPGGVRAAHRGRRRDCGAGGEALGL